MAVSKEFFTLLGAYRATIYLGEQEGLQKEIFNSFIFELQQYCCPHNVGLGKDYRRLIASRPHQLVCEFQIFPFFDCFHSTRGCGRLVC